MEDTASFKEMLWMTYDTFLNLLTVSEPYISPQESYHAIMELPQSKLMKGWHLHYAFWQQEIATISVSNIVFSYFLYCFLSMWTFD